MSPIFIRINFKIKTLFGECREEHGIYSLTFWWCPLLGVMIMGKSVKLSNDISSSNWW